MNKVDLTNPKFRLTMMLSLGAIIGLISYLLVLFASASAYPDAYISGGSHDPSDVTVGTRVTFTTNVTNKGGSEAPLPLLTVCIYKGSGRSAHECDDETTGWVYRNTFGIDTVNPGATVSKSWNWTPTDPLSIGRHEVSACVYGLYNDDDNSNNCRFYDVFDLQNSQINLVGKHLSYASAKRTGAAVVVPPTGTSVVTPSVWRIKEGAAVTFHGYIANIGTANANISSTARFCVDNPACGHDATLGPWTSTASVGSVTTGLIGNYIRSSSTWQATLGPHTATLCPDVSQAVPEIQPDVKGSDCVDMLIYVVTTDVYNALPGPASAPIGSGAPDGYGTGSFDYLKAVLNQYRPVCAGLPEMAKCS